MNLEEIKSEKDIMEMKILQIIEEFNSKTGIKISECFLEYKDAGLGRRVYNVGAKIII